MNVKDTVCDALEKEGLLDPESREAISFCTSSCPYAKCVVVEGGLAVAKKDASVRRAKVLASLGYTEDHIMEVMGVSRRTLRRRLAKAGKGA